MKNQNKIIIETVIIFISVILALYIWRFISLPFKGIDIIGEYQSRSYHSLNDVLRYFIFILIPLLVFLVIKFINNPDFFKIFIYNLKKQESDTKKNFSINFFLFLILSVYTIQFFSTSFENFNLDVYHDGQKISGAYKNLIEGSLWSGSYVTVGIFHEVLMSKIAWSITGEVSIGSSRIIEIFLIFLSKLLLITVAYQISINSNIKNSNQSLLLILLSIIFMSLNDYDLGSVDHFSYRDIPILLLIIFFPFIEKNNFFSTFLSIVLGFLTIPVLFWALDRGIIYNLILLVLIVYFIIKSQKKIWISLITSSIISILLFKFLLGFEFNYFIENSVNILNEINYIHGIIHPIPLTSDVNSTRATKSLLLIIFSLIISINLFFKEDNKYKILKKFFLILSMFCILSYINALGRSDGPHIKSIFGFQIIFLSSFLIFNILYFFENKIKINFDKNIYKSCLLIIIFVNAFFMGLNYSKVINFKERLKNYAVADDKKFLKNRNIKDINDVKDIIYGEKCIQLFSNFAIMPYLLKKKNCTKYYFVWSVGSEKTQKKMINEMKSVNFILSDKFNDNHYLSPNYKLPLVKKYVNENYYIFKSFDEFDLLKKSE